MTLTVFQKVHLWYYLTEDTGKVRFSWKIMVINYVIWFLFFWSPQMWTTHAQPGDRYSHALVVTWLGRHVWPRCRERSFYTGFLFPCALLLRPTRQHHRVFLHAPFARWSCSADHKVWQHVSATWCPETDEKPCSYPTYTAMSRWQHQNQLNLWTIPDTNNGD